MQISSVPPPPPFLLSVSAQYCYLITLNWCKEMVDYDRSNNDRTQTDFRFIFSIWDESDICEGTKTE